MITIASPIARKETQKSLIEAVYVTDYLHGYAPLRRARAGSFDRACRTGEALAGRLRDRHSGNAPRQTVRARTRGRLFAGQAGRAGAWYSRLATRFVQEGREQRSTGGLSCRPLYRRRLRADSAAERTRSATPGH